jgi:hypothetical protein
LAEEEGGEVMCEIEYDGETCTVWNETYHKARKAHRCDSCFLQIVPGERYMAHFSVYDGEGNYEKACAKCSEAMGRFAEEHGSVQPYSFWELLMECVASSSDSEDVWGLDKLRLQIRLAKATRIQKFTLLFPIVAKLDELEKTRS